MQGPWGRWLVMVAAPCQHRADNKCGQPCFPRPSHWPNVSRADGQEWGNGDALAGLPRCCGVRPSPGLKRTSCLSSVLVEQHRVAGNSLSPSCVSLCSSPERVEEYGCGACDRRAASVDASEQPYAPEQRADCGARPAPHSSTQAGGVARQHAAAELKRAPLRHQEVEASLIGAASQTHAEQSTTGHAGYAARLLDPQARDNPMGPEHCWQCPHTQQTCSGLLACRWEDANGFGGPGHAWPASSYHQYPQVCGRMRCWL